VTHAFTSARRLATLLLIATLGAGCGLADIRPESFVKEGVTPDAATRGKAALERVAAAHGGVERLKAARVAEVVMQDTWPAFLTRLVGMPWDDSPQTLKLTWLLGQDTAKLELLDGDDKGDQWGVQQWCTWTAKAGKDPVFKADEDAWFWLPTLEYFVEAPWRLREATTAAHLGVKERGGKRYERVFFTWGSVEPQEGADQYIAWIEEDTGRLAFLEFTARDVYGFVTGIAIYERYRDVSGLLFAGTITIVTDHDTFEDTLHRMELQTIQLAPETPTEALIPKPSCKVRKDARGG
jgi:hypothetical protein